MSLWILLLLSFCVFNNIACSQAVADTPQQQPQQPQQPQKCVPLSAPQLEDLKTAIARDIHADVLDGKFTIYDTTRCEGNKEGCYMQNPATPYGLLLLPYHPDEVGEYEDDPSFINALNPDARDLYKWRLRSDEVVILTGCTPPPMRYYSMVNYIWDTRKYGRWKSVFGSLGDAVNFKHVEQALSDTPLASQRGFDVPFAVVLTGTPALATRVTALLRRVLPSHAFIHTLPFPARVVEKDSLFQKADLHYGLKQHDDLFSFLFRFAYPVAGAEQEWQQWRSDPPLHVLRVSPSDATEYEQEVKYGPPEVREREAKSADGLHADELWLSDRYNELTTQVFQSHSAVEADGYHVIQSPVTLKRQDIPVRDWGGLCYMGWFKGLYPLSCLGEVRDTSYLIPIPGVVLDQKDFLILTGVNHQRTGFATYANFAIYNFQEKVGIQSIADDELRHTQQAFLAPSSSASDVDMDDDYFYAVKIAYDCANTPLNEYRGHPVKCVEIRQKGKVPYPNAAPGKTKIWIIERAYMHPTTLVGPEDKQLLDPTFVLFKHESSKGSGYGWQLLMWLYLFRKDAMQLTYALFVSAFHWLSAATHPYVAWAVLGFAGLRTLLSMLSGVIGLCCHCGTERAASSSFSSKRAKQD